MKDVTSKNIFSHFYPKKKKKKKKWILFHNIFGNGLNKGEFIHFHRKELLSE